METIILLLTLLNIGLLLFVVVNTRKNGQDGNSGEILAKIASLEEGQGADDRSL